MKVFNTTGVCVPKKHYMVNIENRLKKIKKLVDGESYFVINKARQYGKTTTLRVLNQYLKNDYHVVFIDFQTFSNADFGAENIFPLLLQWNLRSYLIIMIMKRIRNLKMR